MAQLASNSATVEQSQCSDYQDALQRLYRPLNYERAPNAPYDSGHYRLDRMRKLLDLLGNPQASYDIIHVAGTKGKGTTANLIAAGLSGCDKRVGLFTSPHLVSLEERFQIDGNPCSHKDLVELVREVDRAAGLLESTEYGGPTFFEMTTAIGMLHFEHQRADAVVLEVGMGGRLDSTNVCQPLVSVITSISLDHQAQLGETIQEISREKAGIIKPGIPVVCAAESADAQRVIIDVAHQNRAPLTVAGRDYGAHWQASSNLNRAAPLPAASIRFSHLADEASLWHGSIWQTQLLGKHHGDNLAAAVATFVLLQEHYRWDLPLEQLKTAIAHCQPPARLQIVDTSPVTIVDTVHNEAPISAGLSALATHFPEYQIVCLFATSRDKDYGSILEKLLPRTSVAFLTEFHSNPRALPCSELLQAAQETIHASSSSASCQLHTVTSPSEALCAARERACDTPKQLVYITGSFFLAAELLPEFNR